MSCSETDGTVCVAIQDALDAEAFAALLGAARRFGGRYGAREAGHSGFLFESMPGAEAFVREFGRLVEPRTDERTPRERLDAFFELCTRTMEGDAAVSVRDLMRLEKAVADLKAQMHAWLDTKVEACDRAPLWRLDAPALIGRAAAECEPVRERAAAVGLLPAGRTIADTGLSRA